MALGAEEAERPELEGAAITGQEPAAQALRLRLAPPAPLRPSLDVAREPPTLSASARLSSPRTTPQPSPPSPGSPPRRPGLRFSRDAESHWQEALCRVLEALGRPVGSRRTLPPQLPSPRNQPVTNYPPRDPWDPIPPRLPFIWRKGKGDTRHPPQPGQCAPSQPGLGHPHTHTHRTASSRPPLLHEQDIQNTSQPQAPHIPPHKDTPHTRALPQSSQFATHVTPSQGKILISITRWSDQPTSERGLGR